ncbi:MAG: hypothetical protein ACR2QA_11340 [Solirubrobacteraceae bacterium]
MAPGEDKRGRASPRIDLSAVGSSAPGPAPRGQAFPPPGRAEAFWPPQLALLLAIALQLLLPGRLTAGPTWLLPVLEAALLIGLAVASPRQLEHEHMGRRRIALTLTVLVSAANVYSLVLLSRELLRHSSPNGRELILAGALIWLTNVLIFSLWYWEADRGGPGRRAAGGDQPPDFLFPQMQDDRIEPRHWRPGFIDYLYVSLTNATAFSPTDTMPLTPTAKSMMGLQSLVSLVTIGLVVSRAVNIL